MLLRHNANNVRWPNTETVPRSSTQPPFNKFSFVGIGVRAKCIASRYPLFVGWNSFERAFPRKRRKSYPKIPKHTQTQFLHFIFHFSLLFLNFWILFFFILSIAQNILAKKKKSICRPFIVRRGKHNRGSKFFFSLTHKPTLSI